jgi:o-succinylbenzoate synthase
VQVDVEPQVLRFARPLTLAYGRLDSRQLLVLRLTEDGLTGRGEAAPLEPYDGVTLAQGREALEVYRNVLEGTERRGRADRLAACRAACDLPQALAAVDLALWELEALRAGRPLAEVLSDSPLTRIELSAAVDAGEPATAADQAAAWARQGFGCLKLKVGTGDDEGRVRAVRAATGPALKLRLDANGAWSVDRAAAALDALTPARPELVEEPVRGLAALRQLRERIDLPVAIDETAADPEALTAGVADAVCLKLARCGGVSGLLEAASAARAAGSRVYLGSSYDGPLGIAAAIHAAAAIRPDHPSGLATLSLFEHADQIPMSQGTVAVPTAPGLGV